LFQDPIALHRFEELNHKYRFRAVVETGTYRAESTLIFSYYVPNVYTVEINSENARIALSTVLSKGYVQKDGACVKGDRQIIIFQGNSPQWLESFKDIFPTPTCYFLDAHWGKDWPLLGELKALIGKKNSVIIIHDFKVSGKDFGYDRYQGQELDYDYVKEGLAQINPDYIQTIPLRLRSAVYHFRSRNAL